MGILTAIIQFVLALFGLGRKNQDVVNAPDIKEAKIKEDRQKDKDEIQKVTAAGDDDAIRRNLAE